MSRFSPDPRAHFGRTKGHRLSRTRAALFQTLLPKLSIDTTQAGGETLSRLFPRRPKAIHLEIGYGGGEHLLHNARHHPDTGFIGCEVFEEGVAKALAGIDALKIDNVRLHFGDAIDIIQWLPDRSIDRAYLLYPDPWPKRRHWKRRFIGKDRLEELARVLKPGGEFRFASDISSNITWTLMHMAQNPAMHWRGERASDWQSPWPDWLSTRYEQKALREGRRPAYFIFERR